ncbi:phosphate-starvation-inducible PsiE family protein [Methanofollis tationis]|uniref:Phosphate-starvation-inducible PsiE family protein n=1 Tax=Methanofollis tationis TaxID=81417 RepID=A0A7K4HQH1_9EURY|nr:phosphate-starvation-inducible PsiE family protein [Methanofollis tationis]NVO67496.1 phosphate-starvation-inducible PsiE family protein [Methanofollis tationis]
MTGPDEEIPQMQWAISAIMRANYLIYFCIAIILVLLAFASFYDVALEFLQAFEGGLVTTNGILQVLHALLVTIIIIEILETVTAYFRTNQLQVRPILIAGLTAMVRKVLVYGLEPTDLIDVVGTVAVIAVLTAAIAVVGREQEV